MEQNKTSGQPAPLTLWQKLSVPLLTIGVALMVFFFKWLFGTMYPADSHRVYTNWEITELTAENLLTEKRLDGIRQTIDRKGEKAIWVDAINGISFSSSGKLLAADITFLAAERNSDQALRYHLTLTEEGEHPVRLERLEGYVPLEGSAAGRVPYDLMYSLSHHPMAELANQKPIANESHFMMASAGTASVETNRQGEALRKEVEEGLVWFVRYDGGWFTVTDPEQISPQFLPVVLSVRGKDAEPFLYGWLMLEIPSSPENERKVAAE